MSNEEFVRKLIMQYDHDKFMAYEVVTDISKKMDDAMKYGIDCIPIINRAIDKLTIIKDRLRGVYPEKRSPRHKEIEKDIDYLTERFITHCYVNSKSNNRRTQIMISSMAITMLRTLREEQYYKIKGEREPDVYSANNMEYINLKEDDKEDIGDVEYIDLKEDDEEETK